MNATSAPPEKEGLCQRSELSAREALGPVSASPPREGTSTPVRRAPPDQRQGLKTTGFLSASGTKSPDLKPSSAFLDGANYLPIIIPTGKLEPLVARLMGATTATRVGDGADCLFFGGNAGGGLKQSKEPYQTRHPTKCFINRYWGMGGGFFHYQTLHTCFSHFQLPSHQCQKTSIQSCCFSFRNKWYQFLLG